MARTRPRSQPSRTTPAWWSRATADGRDLLLACALAEFPLPATWLAAWRIPDATIDRLLAQTPLEATADGLALPSPEDRATVLRLATWSRRKALHRRLAEACQRPPARWDAAARHFDLAGDALAATRAHLAAANAHCRRHRHAAAHTAFVAALRRLPADLPDAETIQALQDLNRCATLAGQTAATAQDLQHWLAAPPWTERPALRAEARLVLASLLERDGRHVESARARREAADDLSALARHADAAGALIAASGTLAYSARYLLAQDAAQAALVASRRADDLPLQVQALRLLGLVLGMLGETRAGVARLTEALDLALAHKLTSDAAEAQRLLGTVHEYASRYADEQAAFAQALKYCRRHGASFTAGLCLGCLSYSLLRSGNWNRSEQTARRVLADRSLPAPSRHVAESVLGLLHAHRGETRPALRHLERALARCREIGLVLMDFFNLPGLAWVAESTGQPAQAELRYRELLEFWRSTDDRHDAIPGLSLAATFFADQGRAEDTASVAEALDRIATLTSNPEAAGAALASAGELSLLEDNPARAAARFRAALAQFSLRPLSIEPILVRTRLGLALDRTGRADEARAVLSEARQLARRLGARPLLARAQALLASDLAPKPAAPRIDDPSAAWELLSARQREVARELARGLTNKEIAQHLGLSVRTIDMHVAHVLDRLACRTRAEAAGRIGAMFR